MAWVVVKLQSKDGYPTFTDLIFCNVQRWGQPDEFWPERMVNRAFAPSEKDFSCVALDVWVDHIWLAKVLKAERYKKHRMNHACSKWTHRQVNMNSLKFRKFIQTYCSLIDDSFLAQKLKSTAFWRFNTPCYFLFNWFKSCNTLLSFVWLNDQTINFVLNLM